MTPRDDTTTTPLVAAPADMLEIELPARVESLQQARAETERFLVGSLAAAPGDPIVSELLLALDEAASNVVRHAYPADAPPGPLALRVEVTPTLVRMTVSDEGRGFDLERVPSPDFARPRAGGWGLHLMRQLVSRISLRRTARGSELLLERTRLPARSARAP